MNSHEIVFSGHNKDSVLMNSREMVSLDITGMMCT